MGKSLNFEKVKNYHSKGLWTAQQVKAAVGKWITEGEYKEIIK